MNRLSDAQQDELEAGLVWLFGSPRSGSTWTMRLLGERSEITTINESFLPSHIVPLDLSSPERGEFLQCGKRAEDAHYAFARRYLEAVRPVLRELILTGISQPARELSEAGDPRWIVVKEPNGSHAADTIVSLTPRSRMIFLLRDGRDVIDSLRDAMLNEKSWWRKRNQPRRQPRRKSRVEFVRRHADKWVQRTLATQRAFDALPEEQRLLVRYENLRADTVTELGRIYDWLGLELPEGELERTVRKHEFERLPRMMRGDGKARRAATPGLWRQNLTEEEVDVIVEVMGDKLRELCYEV